MSIGTRIRKLRVSAGLTQEGLAGKIGVTPSAVGNYERGVSFPKEEVLMLLFSALNCSPNELFGSYSESEDEHMEKYKALDTRGKAAVNACTDSEYDRCRGEVLIAARNGLPPHKITLKKRGEMSIFDAPDYKGGR